MKRRCTFTLVMLSLGVAAPVEARELWVDVDSLGGSCSDSLARDQVTAATPWCGLGVAGMRVEAGDTVTVRKGTYSALQSGPSTNDNSVLQVVVSGRSDAWIRFVAMAGEEVIIEPQGAALHGVQVIETYDGIVPRYIEIAGFTIKNATNNCVAVKKTSHVVLRDLDVSGCQQGAVELHESSDVTLEGSRIHDNALGGFTSAVDLYLCKAGNIVRGNQIWNNTDEDIRESEGHGITMDFCKDTGGALIENNVVWSNEGWCMAIYVSDGATIRNNTCYQNGKGRDTTGEISLLGSNHSLHNNILVPRGDTQALNIRDENAHWTSDWSTLAIDYNILWSPSHDQVVAWGDGHWTDTVAQYQTNAHGWGAHDLQLDPALSAPAAGNFELTANSPAVDSGDDGHAAATDITGAARPADGDEDGAAIVDRGAYELSATVASDAGPMVDGPPAQSDAGPAVNDGSIPPPADSSLPAHDGAPVAGDTGGSGNDEGCSCATGGGSPRPFAWLFGLLALVILRRRSRRRGGR